MLVLDGNCCQEIVKNVILGCPKGHDYRMTISGAVCNNPYLQREETFISGN